MRTLSAGLLLHIAQEETALATCVEVTRRDGVVYRSTDHDADLTVSGHVYQSTYSHERNAVSSESDMSVTETTIIGLVDDDGISEHELRAGLWNGARIRMFGVQWSNVASGIVTLLTGFLGEVSQKDNGTFTVEIRGLSQRLQQTIGELYLAECGEDLGGPRCKIPIAPSLHATSTPYVLGDIVRVATDLGATAAYQEESRIYECTDAGTSGGTAPTFDTTVGNTTTDGGVVWTARTAWTRPAEISTATDRETFSLVDDGAVGALDDEYFRAGVATFETGLNAGISRDILEWSSGAFAMRVFLPFPFEISAGDQLRLQPGCSKRLSRCRDHFLNKLNFRGHPHIPGAATIIQTPIR